MAFIKKKYIYNNNNIYICRSKSSNIDHLHASRTHPTRNQTRKEVNLLLELKKITIS